MDEPQKSAFIKQMENGAFVWENSQMKPRDFNDKWVPQKDKIEGSLKLLDELEPQLNSPELKTHFKESREKLLQQLKQAK